MANKLKSVLTGLGIIFGVAAVISMLAIGNGAKQEIIEQIKLVGVNNIIVKPIIKKSSETTEDDDSKKQSKKFSTGLSLADFEAIKSIIPEIEQISPEINYETFAIQNGIKKSVSLLGVHPAYFNLFNMTLMNGVYFNDIQNDNGSTVCIIGPNIKTKFFLNQNPVGKSIKCGTIWLTIIGVLNPKTLISQSNDNLGISNSNEQIFIPAKTMLMRFKNRSIVNSKSFTQNERRGRGMMTSQNEKTDNNYNQLDKIIIQAKETEYLTSISNIVKNMILRRHSGVEDFEIIIPELLLKQQQRTKDIFNIVLGAIASISLIVGGIGIMNIMLASVMERIKEIGTRLAIGATKRDIVVQFLAESTFLSVGGGFIGVLLGFVFSKLITKFADILTIITPDSVIIAFGISALVGILFGYMPAKKASDRDPVESLRYE